MQEERLHKEARILGLTNNVPNRKRACTIERTGRTARKAPPQVTRIASSFNASVKSRYSGRTSSTASDPSMEKFLTHVRASQEARAMKRSSGQAEKGEKMNQSVFVDEREKGWFNLSDKPL